MKLYPAKSFDINSIMAIERSAFIPQIQEKQKTFEERMSVFPNGFLILQDVSEKTVLEQGHAVTAGYFCSEIWPSVPEDKFFELGHSAKKMHDDTGSVLYVSSFALAPDYRGKGLSFNFFKDSLNSICGAYNSIKTVVLLVNEEWTGALSVYKKLNFKTLRIIKGFFPSLHKAKTDGFIMTASADYFRMNEGISND